MSFSEATTPARPSSSPKDEITFPSDSCATAAAHNHGGSFTPWKLRAVAALRHLLDGTGPDCCKGNVAGRLRKTGGAGHFTRIAAFVRMDC